MTHLRKVVWQPIFVLPESPKRGFQRENINLLPEGAATTMKCRRPTGLSAA
jgi:hypothetical protein